MLAEKADKHRLTVANARAYVAHFDAHIKPMIADLQGCNQLNECVEEAESKIAEELGRMESKWISSEFPTHPKVFERQGLVDEAIKSQRRN